VICRKRSAVLCLILAFWLTLLPVWAKPSLLQLRIFGSELELRFKAGDQAGFLKQACASPELSWIVLEYWMSPACTPAQPSSIQSLLARGLQLSGDTRGVDRLKAAGQLDPAVALLTPEQAPARDLAAPLEQLDWGVWGLALSERLIDLGNYRQVLQLGSGFQAFARESGLSSTQADLYLAECAILSGQSQVARQRKQQLRAWADSLTDPEERAYLQALMLGAAFQAGDSQLEAECLAALQSLLPTLTEARRGLYQFVVETHRARQRVRESSEQDWPAMVARHRAAFDAIAGFHPQFQRNRLWIQAGDFWTFFLQVAPSKGADPDQVLQLQTLTSKELNRLAHEGIEQNSYAAHFGTLLVSLDSSLRALQAGQPVSLASRLLQVCEPVQLQTRQWLLQEQEEFQQAMPGPLRRRLGEKFQVDLLSGQFSLVESRLALLRLYRNPSHWVQALDACDRLASQARLQVGHQSLRDARWYCLDWLEQARPKGWQARCDRFLAAMLSECQQCSDRPGLISLWARRGVLHQDIQALQTSLNLLEPYLAEVGAGAGLRRSYEATYSNLARLLLKKGRQAESLQVLARMGSTAALERGLQALQDRPEGKTLGRLARQNRQLEEEVSLQRSLDPTAPPLTEALQDRRRQYEQALTELGQSHPQYNQVLHLRPVQIEVLQRTLPADACLIQYFPGPEELHIFLVTRESLKVRRVGVGARDLTRSALKFRSSLLSPNLAGYRPDREWVRQSRQLYDWLIAPVESDLKGRKLLAILPSGPLHYLPFPALIREAGSQRPEYLVERFPCVNLTRASDLVALSQPRIQPQGSVVALANPDGSLPGAEQEARRIVSLIPGSRLFLGSQAEAACLNLLPAGTRYVHVATHGHLRSDDPGNSFLILAGSGEAAKFRISDIYGLNWPGIRLVGLSACETALPENPDGSEMVSLAQAFSVAGGRAILASLWSVSDKATEKLMVNFYQQLLTAPSLAQALQKSQIAMISDPNFSHPYFWAAFPLLGDWR